MCHPVTVFNNIDFVKRVYFRGQLFPWVGGQLTATRGMRTSLLKAAICDWVTIIVIVKARELDPG